MQEKLDLMTWVEALPRREHMRDFPSVLTGCAERYGNRQRDLEMILNYLVEAFRRSMAGQINKFRKLQDVPNGVLPDPDKLNEMFESALKATLLKMWTYSNEHYQRWRGEDVFGVTVTDDLLGQLLSAPNDEPTQDES